jgi:hypothetical protein
MPDAGKNLTKPAFRWGKAFVKGLKGAAIAGLAAASAAASDGKVAPEDLQAAFIAGAVGFLFETGRNWLKNK